MKKTLRIIALLLIVAISTGILGGCGNSTGKGATEGNSKGNVKAEDNKLTIGMAGVDIKTACIILAKELGYYEDEGVDVQFEKITSLPDALTAVSMDKLDVLPFGIIPTCSFVSQGTDVVIIGGTITEGSEAITLPENKDKYNSLDSFKDKTVACFRMETGHMVMKGLLMDAGYDLGKDVNFVYMDSQASILEAVLKGEADIGFVNSGYGYIAQTSGAVIAFQVADFKGDFPCCRQTIARNTLKNKQDTLVNYMVANLRGYQTYLNDKETAIKALAAYSGQDEKYVKSVMYGSDGEYENAMKISLNPNKKAVVDFYNTMKQIGDIDSNTKYDISSYVETSIYEKALAVMTEREPDNGLWKILKDELNETSN